MLDPQNERARILETAGKIILQDIRSKTFNTTFYLPIDNFHASAYNFIPNTLLLLLHIIILTNKQGSFEMWKKKCLAFSHTIIVAV
jgi:1-deoxy-D-xylulose 5-phosphate reductoisomerase